MAIKELKNFIFENYYKRIGLPKENSYYPMKYPKKKDLLLLATKLIEIKCLMPVMLRNIIVLIWNEKNKKLVKRSNLIKNPNIVYIRSVFTKHSKISQKLSKAIRQTEKASLVDAGKKSNSPLFSETKHWKIFGWKSHDSFMLIKVTQVLMVSRFWLLSILNYKLKILNIQLWIISYNYWLNWKAFNSWQHWI